MTPLRRAFTTWPAGEPGNRPPLWGDSRRVTIQRFVRGCLAPAALHPRACGGPGWGDDEGACSLGGTCAPLVRCPGVPASVGPGQPPEASTPGARMANGLRGEYRMASPGTPCVHSLTSLALGCQPALSSDQTTCLLGFGRRKTAWSSSTSRVHPRSRRCSHPCAGDRADPGRRYRWEEECH